MPFAIYRVVKLKSMGAIRGSAAHNSRGRLTPNADKTRTALNSQLHGFDLRIPSPDEFVCEWQRRVSGVKRKPDAVLAQELFLGTSPEFYAHCATEAEKDEQARRWSELSLGWLDREFGELLMSVTLHVDETTPHLCAYVVPIAKAKDGSEWLSAKRWFNPLSLAKQQDTYAAALVEMGLQRGVKGSRAEHERVQTFYAELQQASPLIESLKSATQRVEEIQAPERGFFESAEPYRQRVNSIVKEKTSVLCSAAEQVGALANEAVMQRRKLNAERATNQALSRDLDATKTKLAQLAETVRDIPLPDVMARLGFGDPQCEGSARVWRTGRHVISVSGVKWFDHKNAKGGGKAIDLVKHTMECDFAEAVSWLSGQWSNANAAAAIASAAVEVVQAAPKRDLKDLWNYYARPDVQATEIVRAYLTQSRGISAALVAQTIDQRLLHGSFQTFRDGSRRAWCVFRHLDEESATLGATLRAADESEGGKRCIGNKLDGFFSVAPVGAEPAELVFVEAPVDALSYAEMHPLAKVVSVAGTAIPPKALQLAAKSQCPILVALDNDDAGKRGWEACWATLKSFGQEVVRRVRRGVPFLESWDCKDWNDVLRAKRIDTNIQQNLKALSDANFTSALSGILRLPGARRRDSGASAGRAKR